MINWLNKYDIGGNPGDPLKQFYDRMVKQYPDLKYGQVSNIPFKTSKDNNTASYHENEVNNCIYGLECIPVNERAAFNAEYKKLFPKGSHKLETGKRFKSQEEIDNYIQQEKKVYQNIYLDSNGLIAMPFKTKQPYFQEHLEEVIGKPEQETGVIEQPSNFANIPDSTLSWDQLQEKYKHLGPTDPVYRMPNDDTKGNRIIIGFNYRKPNKDNPRISSPAQIIFDEYKKLGGSTRLLNRYDNGGPGKPKTVKIDFGNGSPYGSGIQEIAIDSPEYKYIYPSLMSKGLDPTSGETLYYGTPMEHIKFTPADSEFYENAENSANTYNPLYFQEGITPTLGPVEYALGAYALAPLVSAAAPALSTALTTDATIGGVTVPGLNLGNALWANGLNTAYNQITDSNSSTNTAINDYNSNPSLGTAANLALQGAIMGWNSSPITSASNQMLFNGINRTGQLGANAFNKVNNFVKGSPGGFNYFKDLGYSLRQGKLPTYRNVTRWQPDRIPTGLLRSGELLTPEQKALTGSWYTYKPEKQLGFYMQTRPGAGNVDVLRLSDRQIMELEKSMPGSAKGMSGKDISTPTSEHHLSGELVIPREIRNRAKSFRFDVNPSEYVFNGHPAYLGVDPGSPFGRSMVGEHALNVVNSNYNNIFGIPRKYFPFKEGGSAKWLDQYDVGGGPCPDGYVKNAVGICVPAPKNISQQFNIQNQLDLRKAAEEKTTDNKPQKPVKPQGLDFATDIDISTPASSTYVAPKVVPNQSQINYDAKVSTRADEIQQKTGTDRKTATDLAKKEINPGTITAVPDKEAAEIKAEGPSYAAQVKADKKAEPLIENNPQGDRTNQEWLASFSPFDQETLMTSNYRSMFQPELWKQSLQGLESLGRFTVNYSPAGLLYKDVANIAGLDNTDLISSPFYVAPGYTEETARDVSPLQTLSVLSYPQRAVQGMMTGSSLLNPEPFLTYNNYGSSNINTQNIAASIASDPLMLPEIGAIPFRLAGAGLRGLGAGYRGLTNLGRGLKNTRLSKLEPLPTLPRFEMPTIPRFELPATTPRFSNHDDFLDAINDFYMHENIPTEYAPESAIQNYHRNLENHLVTNFPEFNINPINLRTSLSTLDPADAQRVYESLYDKVTDLTGNGFFSTDDLNAMRSSVPNVSTPGASRYVPQEYNLSKATRQDLLQRANEQGKAKIANMTDDEFKKSVLKVNGDVEFVDDIGNSLDNVADISEQSYINYFNDNISDLNKKIKANNKSGIDYHVKGLETAYMGFDSGLYNLVIEVPEQTKIIDGVETFIPATTRRWTVTAKPGLFADEVKNINNQTYFQSIPGLEMNITSSGIFPGNLHGRRGSGMYESLNQYLKENALGRVKPGFNSQTQTRIGSDGKVITGSKDVWENFINKGKAYGYYGDLDTVYGIMKRKGGQKKLGGSTGWLDKYPKGGPIDKPTTAMVDLNDGKGIRPVDIASPEYRKVYPALMNTTVDPLTGARTMHQGLMEPLVMEEKKRGFFEKMWNNFTDSKYYPGNWGSDESNSNQNVNFSKTSDQGSQDQDKVHWYETLNYKNWGLNDYSDHQTFNSAFKTARESGDKEFMWNDKRYNTDLVPEGTSNKYWDAKRFLQDYYTNENFTPLDTSTYNLYDFYDNYTKNKYGYTWSEYFDKIKNTPEYLDPNPNPTSDKYQDTLDLLDKPMFYSQYSDEAKTALNNYSRDKYIKALNDPSYYFSITSQPDPKNPVLGYHDGGKKKFYVSDTGTMNDFTTFVHELSHKGDSESRIDYYSKDSRIPEIDIDRINKFGSRLDQERFNYVSDPSETEARKMSTLYYMDRVLNKNIKSGQIKKEDLQELYDTYNAEGGYNQSKSIPVDIQDLLELYKWQQDDLLKYLNNDFSYIKPAKQKLGGVAKYPWGGPAFDPKTINEGVQKARYQNALDWHEDWMNSPKYKEMLYKDGANSKDSSLVDRTRKNNLSQIRKQPLNISYEDYPNMRAMYSPDNKNVTLYTEGWKKPTVLTHEVGHAVDLNHLDPSALSENKDKLTMPQEDINFITNRRFPKTKDGFFISPEGIKIDEIDPSFRTAPLLYPTPEKYVDFGDQQFRWAMGHPYFTRPTEVRSRLSEIRKYSQDNGVYDPFTQGAPKSVLDINHPAMQELKSYYSDDDIMEMLNRISYNNNNSDQTGVYQSKFGGVIKYQDGGSKEMPLGLPLKEQNPYLVPEHYKPTANGYILPDSARAQLLNTGASEYKYTYGFDDGEVQVPSIVGGQYIGDQAIDRYMLTGEQFKPMTDPRSYSNFYDDMSRLGLMQPDYNPKYKKGGVKSSAEGYYDYINGYKGVSLSKGGSSKKGWLEKYK